MVTYCFHSDLEKNIDLHLFNINIIMYGYY